MADLETINLSIVEEAKDLMSERFPTMIKYFLEDTRMYIGEIENSVQNNDFEIAISPAHTIKSSAKQLGAEKVSDVARQIEQFARDMLDNKGDDFDTLDKLYHELKEEFEAVAPLLVEVAED